jgi:hypothetical protein
MRLCGQVSCPLEISNSMRRRVLCRSRFDDPESQIGQLLGLSEPDALEFDPSGVRISEQADASAEEYRGDVEHDLIEQADLKALASESGAKDPHVRISGLLLRHRNARSPHPTGHPSRRPARR